MSATQAHPDANLAERLQKLTQIGIALSAEQDLDRLLDKILFEGRRFARAQAGTLYVREGEELRFAVVQNDLLPETQPPDGGLPITETSIAGYVAGTGTLLHLSDVDVLPERAPYSFNDSFDRASGFKTRSMLVIPMTDPDGRVNGVIQLINAIDPETDETGPFDVSLIPLCQSLASQAGVALRNARLHEQLERAYEETIFLLSRAAEVRDSDTGAHIRRVAHYSEALALEIGMPEAQAHQLRLASPMHDVGKLHLSDAVLKKPGRLDPDERVEIERHTMYGHKILAPSSAPLLRLASEIALTHHEKWNGKGYPRGLDREDIPLVGRITAVADVFDALTSKRCYKDAMPVEKAVSILEKDAGSHFDPVIVDAFVRILPKILRIKARYQTDPADEADPLCTP